ncbi:hypothetical protein QZH41_003374 [Actinostola sp. cb2023]|nr:hypothetical protein QZH41_003374 [Actinostola sp. cb2023]
MLHSSHSKQMAEACNTAKINRPMFFTAIDIRNWLIFSMTVENFNRAGICSNITVKECADAKKIDDHYAIHVSEHKTAGTYGGAIVNLSIDLYSSLKSWMENIRCRMEGDKPDKPDVKPSPTSKKHDTNLAVITVGAAGLA